MNLDQATASNDAGSAPPFATPGELSWILCAQPSERASVQRVAVTTNPFNIGRNPDCDLCISNQTVSGHHAELVFVENDIFLRDVDSTNGTLLNGRRVRTLTGLRSGDILHFGSAMFVLQHTQQEVGKATVTTNAADEAIAQVQFDTLIKKRAVQPFFQPIVQLQDGSRVGYEVLTRSRFVGLETPAKMFRVAAQRTSERELSEVCRSEGLRAAQVLDVGMQYYLNTHPKEMESKELLDSLTELRCDFPELSFMLEIHESGVTSANYLRELRRILNDLNIGLAYDDFGSGQARLMELSEVPPDVLKFDIKLIQGLESASKERRSTVDSLVQMVHDLDIVALAEGVEKQVEADICRELGFELAQGYLFGRPQPAKTWLIP